MNPGDQLAAVEDPDHVNPNPRHPTGAIRVDVDRTRPTDVAIDLAVTLDLLVLRDSRESAKKCSLTPLRGTAGVRFAAYRPDRRVPVGRRVVLHPDGDELGPDDRGVPLLVVDCAWRKLPTLLACVDGDLLPRRLPHLITAYPRASRHFDPEHGLASIEAVYAALRLLGADRPDLLDGYRWGDEFLRLNAETLQRAALTAATMST